MVFWRQRRSGTAVLAVLALLALVLVPSVSRALSPLAPAQFIADLCRSDAGSTPGGSHDAAHALLACGLCTVAAAPLLPPAPTAVALARPAAAAPAVPARTVPVARLLHAPAQARAPPAGA